MSTFSYQTTKQEAIHAAALFATKSGLPMTVYKTDGSGGWWYTNATAPLLELSGTRKFVTILPERYFDR